MPLPSNGIVDLVYGVSTKRLVRCWEATPAEATGITPVRVTDHSSPIELDGNTYWPLGGVNSSASQATAGLRPANVELRGPLRVGKFELNHLAVGLWDGAEVRMRLVDWRYPHAGAIRNETYNIDQVSVDIDRWAGDLLTKEASLRSATGSVLSRDCPHTLGDATRCKVNIATHTETGAVTAVTSRARFDTDLTPSADNYYQFGELTWTSGANAGTSQEVKLSWITDGEVQLQLEAPLGVEIGDEFEVYPGCGRRPGWCKGTAGDKNRPWANNMDNYGGFDDIPGGDRLNRTPDAE